MSLGGTANKALDDAVRSTIASGVQIAIAAGNSNMDAYLTSPARVSDAITVAASDIENKKASFSNYGLVVDIFAPGVSVTSAWIGSNTAVNTISGTSMATPHVAGLCAYILAQRKSQGSPLSPAQLQNEVKRLGTSGVVSGVPLLTPNLLAYNGGEKGIDSTASGAGAATDASDASATNASVAGANVLSTSSSSAAGALSTANAANFEALSNSVPSNVPNGRAQTQ
jgi:subtilisin family serine protease